MSDTQAARGEGYVPDHADGATDRRTYGIRSPEVMEALGIGGKNTEARMRELERRLAQVVESLPPRVDLKEKGFTTAVRDQGPWNTCSANVVASLFTFLQRQDYEKRKQSGEGAPDRDDSEAASRLFLHQGAALLRKKSFEDGQRIRDVLRVTVKFGVPLNRYWRYPKPPKLEPGDKPPPFPSAEPTAFVFRVAEDFKVLRYFRVDLPDLEELGWVQEAMTRPPTTPTLVKGENRDYLCVLMKAVMKGFELPVTVGFRNYPRAILFPDAKGQDQFAPTKTGQRKLLTTFPEVTGHIPFPHPSDSDDLGLGHAVLLVGYDDEKKIPHPLHPEWETTGAFLFQNSWGKDWGERGFGWLPYDYVRQGQTHDSKGRLEDDVWASDIWTISEATFTAEKGVRDTKTHVGIRKGGFWGRTWSKLAGLVKSK